MVKYKTRPQQQNPYGTGDEQTHAHEDDNNNEPLSSRSREKEEFYQCRYYFIKWKQRTKTSQMNWKQRVLGTAIRVHFVLLRSVRRWDEETKRNQLLTKVTRACYARILLWKALEALRSRATETAHFCHLEQQLCHTLQRKRIQNCLWYWKACKEYRTQMRDAYGTVVDQRKTRILFGAFDWWKHYKQQLKEYQSLTEKASHQFRTWRMQKAITLWKMFACTNVHRQRLIEMKDTFQRYRLLRFGFRTWNENAEEKKEDNRKLDTAINFDEVREIRTHFRILARHVHSVKVNRRMETLATAFRHRKLLVEAFQALRRPWERMIELRRVEESAPLLYERALQRRCVRALRRHTENTVIERKQLSVARCSLRRWRRMLLHIRSENRNYHKALSHHKELSRRHALHQLKAACSRQAFLSNTFEAVHRRSQGKRVHACWKQWVSALEEKQKENMAEKHYAYKMKTLIIFHWNCLTWAKRNNRVADWHWQMSTEAKAWAALLWWHRLRQKQLEPWKRAQSHHNKKLLAKSFNEIKRQILYRKALDVYTERLRVSRQIRKQRCALGKWVNWYQEHRRLQKLTFELCCFHIRRIESQYIRIWIRFIRNRKENRARTSELEDKVTWFRKKVAVRRWMYRTEDEEKRRTDIRSATNTLVTTIHHRRFNKAVGDWYDWLCRRKVLRYLYSDAKTFYTRRRLRGAIKTWRCNHDLEDKRKTLKERAMQHFRENKEKRMFDRWVAFHSKCKMHMEKIDAAEASWIFRLRKGLLDYWRSATVKAAYERRRREEAQARREKLVIESCFQQMISQANMIYNREREEASRRQKLSRLKEKMSVRMIEKFYLRVKNYLLQKAIPSRQIDFQPIFWSPLQQPPVNSPPRSTNHHDNVSTPPRYSKLKKAVESHATYHSRAAILIDALTKKTGRVMSHNSVGGSEFEPPMETRQVVAARPRHAVSTFHKSSRRKPRVPSFVASSQGFWLSPALENG